MSPRGVARASTSPAFAQACAESGQSAAKILKSLHDIAHADARRRHEGSLSLGEASKMNQDVAQLRTENERLAQRVADLEAREVTIKAQHAELMATARADDGQESVALLSLSVASVAAAAVPAAPPISAIPIVSSTLDIPSSPSHDVGISDAEHPPPDTTSLSLDDPSLLTMPIDDFEQFLLGFKPSSNT